MFFFQKSMLHAAGSIQTLPEGQQMWSI